MNLQLTNYCNRSCSYCFARNKIRGEEDSRADFDPKDLNLIISFLKKSGEQKLTVLGGEPTLNPRCPAIFSALLAEGFRLQIFTNGLIPEETLSFLKTAAGERLNLVVNANPPESYGKSEWERLGLTLATLGPAASLGFNIDTVPFSFSFLFGLIKKYHLGKTLRLGIAQPILGAVNRFVPLDRYKDLAPNITRLVKQADRHDVTVMFDCGFLLCMFTPAQLGRLYLSGARLRFYCGPAIDIGADLSAWHCFALSAVENVQLDRFENSAQLSRFYSRRLAPYRSLGALERCRGCRYLLRGQCAGGCLAHTMSRFRKG